MNNVEKLVERILDLEEGESFNWVLRDVADNITINMGTKLIRLFDCRMIITAAWGGGFESIICLWGDDEQSITDHFTNEYVGMSFEGFGSVKT